MFQINWNEFKLDFPPLTKSSRRLTCSQHKARTWTRQTERLRSGRACLTISHAFFNNNLLQSKVTSPVPSPNLHLSTRRPCDLEIRRTLLAAWSEVAKVEQLSASGKKGRVSILFDCANTNHHFCLKPD